MRTHPTASGLRILGLSVLFSSIGWAAAPGDAAGAASLLSHASQGWWEQVQRSIQLEEYGAVAYDDAEPEYRTANPAQDFDSRFDERGCWSWRSAVTCGRCSPRMDMRWTSTTAATSAC